MIEKKKRVERGAKRKSYQYPPCSEVDALSGVNDESNAKEGERRMVFGEYEGGIAIEGVRRGAFLTVVHCLSPATRM